MTVHSGLLATHITVRCLLTNMLRGLCLGVEEYIERERLREEEEEKEEEQQEEEEEAER
jgi:hypothetical protein